MSRGTRGYTGYTAPASQPAAPKNSGKNEPGIVREGGLYDLTDEQAAQVVNPGTTWQGTQGDRFYNTRWAPHDTRNFQFGRDPAAADAAVQMAYNTGQGAQKTGEGLLSIGMERSRLAGERPIYMQNWGQQNQALGAAGAYGNQLAGLEAQQGPSAAQAQLQAGTNQAMAGQLALARSGSGFGGNAASAGLAQTNLAGLGAANANNAAMLRAQEDAAWRQRQAGNIAQAAGIQQGIGSQFGEQGARDINAFNAGQAQNDAASMGWAGFGAGAYGQGITANLQGQGVANQVRGMELNAGMSLEDQMLRRWAAQNGFDLQNAAAQQQQNAALIQGGATIAGGAIGTVFGGPAGGAAGAAGGNALGKAVTG